MLRKIWKTELFSSLSETHLTKTFPSRIGLLHCERHSQSRASFCGHYWFRCTYYIQKKKFVFIFRTHIRDEPALPDPARPGPTRPLRSLTAYLSNVLKDTSWKLSHYIVSGLQSVVTNIPRDFFNISEGIAFFTKTDFCHFYTHFWV